MLFESEGGIEEHFLSNVLWFQLKINHIFEDFWPQWHKGLHITDSETPWTQTKRVWGIISYNFFWLISEKIKTLHQNRPVKRSCCGAERPAALVLLVLSADPVARRQKTILREKQTVLNSFYQHKRLVVPLLWFISAELNSLRGKKSETRTDSGLFRISMDFN